MSSFTIPPEYKDFVSDSADLLRQFSTKDEVDRISFKIYFSKSVNVEKSYSIYQNIASFITEQIKDYIWHCERPTFQLVYPDSLFQNTNTNTKTSSTISPTDEIYIFGNCRVGNNIEDEWYLTYILLLTSKAYSEYMIYLYDSDDQFLLVEAAEALPGWLGPENSENRTWIKNGLIHIISIEEGGIDKYGVLKLSHALSIMRNTIVPSTFVGYTNSNFYAGIQEIINKRTLDVYPAKLTAINHKSIILIPRVIADLLIAYPQLVTPAVHALGDVASAGFHHDKPLKQCVSELTYFKPYVSDMVAISVNHTRALHSQLTYHTIPPPKCVHTRHLEVLSRVGADAKIKSSLDLGTRILCGFEAMYYLSRRENINITTTASAASASSSSSLNTGDGEQTSCFPAYVIRGSAVPSANKPHDDTFSNSLIPTSTSNSHDNTSHGVVYNIIQSNEPWVRQPVSAVLDTFIKNLVTTKIDDNSNTHSNSNNTIIELDSLIQNRVKLYNQYDDSTAWLFMSPEEFEKDMEETIRKHRYTTVFPPSDDTATVPATVDATSEASENMDTPAYIESNAISSDTSVIKNDDTYVRNEETIVSEPLQSIVDRMKSFMVSESDFDGISETKYPKQNISIPNSTPIVSDPASEPTESILRILSVPPSSSLLVLDQVDWSAIDLLVSQADTIDFNSLSKNNISPAAANNATSSAANGSESFYAQYFSDEENDDEDDEDDEDGDDGETSSDIDNEIPESSFEDLTRRLTHTFDMDTLNDDNDNSDDEDVDDQEKFMEAYMNAMESELKGNSSLFQAFEKYNSASASGDGQDGDAVDVEANLLKHLLESHASAVDLQQQRGQRWTSGPASVLLSQMGISLPTCEEIPDI